MHQTYTTYVRETNRFLSYKNIHIYEKVFELVCLVSIPKFQVELDLNL